MNEQLLARLRTHRLYIFLQRHEYSEAEIVEAIRNTNSLSEMAEYLELEHPGIPGRPHAVIRVPKAQEDFLEIQQLLETSS